MGVILAGVILAVISTGSRGPSVAQLNHEYDVIVDLVFDQSISIAVGIPNHQKIYPSSNLIDINFSTTAPHGLFSNDFLLAIIKNIPKKYYREGSVYAEESTYSPTANVAEYAAGSWRLNKDVTFNGIATRTIAIVLPDISERLCQRINLELWGDIDILPALGNSLIEWAGPADPTTGSTQAVTLPGSLTRFRQGCAETSDERLFYFSVVATP